MPKSYDLWLVLLSFVVAGIASYVALDLASRVSASRGQRSAGYWLAGGALSMGAGIWAMHFVGMLAFSLPIRVSYDVGITLSLVIAVGVSAFALYTVGGTTLSRLRLAIAGALMGLGIVAMHYTGMAALQVRPAPIYQPLGVLLSVLIAVAASVIALWIAFQLRGETMASAFWRRFGGAAIMGVAIAGMHYSGMAAAQFAPDTICYGGPEALRSGWLAIAVGFCTFLFLATTLLISIFDARLAERTAKLSAQSDRIKLQAEQALGKEREFLKALLENLSDGIVACDEKGILTVFNRATREFHGIPEEPIPPDRWAEHYDLYLADGITRMSKEQVPLFRAFQGETVRDVEFVIAPRGRPRLQLVCSGQPIMAGSEKLGAVIAMHDITERKRYESSLHEAKELAQVTLSSIGDGVIRTDERGCITFCNLAAAKLLATEPEYPLHKTFGELIHLFDDSGRPIADPVEQALRTGSALRVSLFSSIRTLKGEHLPIADSVAPIRDQSGAVIGAVFVFQDVSDTRQMTEKLAFQARNDQLTGLPNRFAFEETLHAGLAAAANTGEIHFLLYIDLDHFKIVNDTSGHAAGDKLLREISALLRAHLRPSDYLARLGGDEFAVLLYGSSAAAARRVAENLIQAVKDYHLVYGGRTFKAGLSIGIAEINDGNADSSTVMAQADTACYAAKDLGRCRYQFYNVDDAQILQAQRHMHWAQRIEQALEEHGFEVHLQKIVDHNRESVGFEALIRMKGEQGRIIGPDAFLPAAKRMGLMVRIDQWMAREVLELVYRRKHESRTGRMHYISINLSAKSAGEPAFVDWMLALIDQYNIGKELLRFEITETEQLNATDTESRLITELRRRGFKVWLDDFGMGYNSFDLLKRLTVDGLKIDRSFTSDLIRDPVDRALVEAIVSLGKAMKLELLAEGVEDQPAFRELCGMGIQYFQGHLFDRATAADAALSL